MKGVILCAGYGERLRPLTNILPKPLFPVLGRPLVERIIYYLRQFGINEICVNTHWLAEKIIEYLGDGSKFGVKTYISDEPKILGIGGGIGAMREFLGNDLFVVHNGDVLSNIDIRPAVEVHVKENAMATLILHDYPEFNNVTVCSDDVIDIGDRIQKSSTNPKLAYTGIAIMDNKILDFLPYKKPYTIVDVWVKLIKMYPGSLKGYAATSSTTPPRTVHWAEIGSIDSYLMLHRNILVERVPLIDNLPPGAVYIGKNTITSNSAKITGFASIGDNCVIEDGVSLEDCVVWDNTTVKAKTTAKSVVLY